MPTKHQKLGSMGELLVAKNCNCPKCDRVNTLKRLTNNFKCVDLICDFCGFLAQVKTTTVRNTEAIPKLVMGAAWAPQLARMNEGIMFPLFLVLVRQGEPAKYSIYYLAADRQTAEMFKPRSPLSATARRAGWQGFHYDLSAVQDQFECRVQRS